MATISSIHARTTHFADRVITDGTCCVRNGLFDRDGMRVVVRQKS
jgi:hypothetical protein